MTTREQAKEVAKAYVINLVEDYFSNIEVMETLPQGSIVYQTKSDKNSWYIPLPDFHKLPGFQTGDYYDLLKISKSDGALSFISKPSS